MFILFVGSATIIKDFRGTFESYKASSSSLNKLEKGLIISPSIYLYVSSHVGVLSKYFQDPREKAMFGENTFQPIYNFLSKFGIALSKIACHFSCVLFSPRSVANQIPARNAPNHKLAI